MSHSPVTPRGEQVEAAKLDMEIVKAIVWCRLGGVRPERDSAFNEAKVLGLLAQDNVWRATEKGEGVLVALGLLDAAPASPRERVSVLWARNVTYSTPQLVGAWSTAIDEHYPDVADAHRAKANQDFGDISGEEWTFWTTVEHIDVPEPPDMSEAILMVAREGSR